jgi:dipeptidyl-peptidase 4
VELTVERLFAAPALSGPAVLGLKISPDGTRVTYLRAQTGDINRLDLWEYDLHEHRSRRLVDSTALDAASKAQSAEESARRERQRTAALSGILEYEYAASGRCLIFGSGGDLYRYSFDRGDDRPLQQLTYAGGSKTDAKISPDGNQLAFVRDQNLVLLDLPTFRERPLTEDGGGPIKNGMAEFVAQEEMDRSTGYWWSPDGARIAFARIDETPVSLKQRFEISADEITTVAQRYPAAGEPNAIVKIGVIDVRTGALRWMDLGPPADVYVARVDWLPDARTLAIQRQSRDQRLLELKFADIETGASRTVISEISDSWIDLHDELSFLKQSNRLIWASSRDGYRHLYLYQSDGTLIRRLTQGDWMVEDFRARAVKCIDEKNGLIYFAATKDHPAERHLYVASLDTRTPEAPRRITKQSGIHSITMSSDARFYVDHFSGPAQPPQTGIHSIDGDACDYLYENRLDETHPYFSFLDAESPPEFGVLTASDGAALHYRLYRPQRIDPSRRYPAIIDVYGGPGVQRVLKNWSGGTFTQILTRAGYFVLQLDGRGSAGRGEAFKSPIRGQLGRAEVEDQLRCAEWLAQLPEIDRSRLGVWGWSYGGYLTLMLMFKAPQRFRAGVAGAPVTDWTLYDTHYTERFLGTPHDNPQGYEASSVLPCANGLQGRLLVMHGMADDNVLFTHSTKLFRKLQRLGKPFEMMTYPGGKHGLTRTADGPHAYMTIKRFFDLNL